MLIAPIVVTIGEQIDVHAERLHPPELRGIGQLRVLQRETVCRIGMLAQCARHTVEYQCRRFAAVVVDVHLQAVFQR